MKRLLFALIFMATIAQAIEQRTQVSQNNGDAVFTLVWDDQTLLVKQLCGTVQFRASGIPACMSIARGNNAQGAPEPKMVPADGTEYCIDVNQNGANAIPVTINSKGKPDGYTDRTAFQGLYMTLSGQPCTQFNQDPKDRCGQCPG